MNKKWFRLLMFIPLLIILTCVNYFVDNVGSFHNISEEIAISILDGNNTAFNSLDEREVKHQIIKNMPNDVDCVAIGPSLIMCVNNDLIHAKSFYNLGTSTSDMFDYLAQFGFIELYNKKINRIIFCLDSQSFDKTLYDTHTANQPLMPYAKYMINILNNSDNTVALKDETKNNIELKDLFSISHFQKNIERYRLTGNTNGCFSVNDNYEGAFYSDDASWNYILDYRKNTEEDVLESIENYDIDILFTPGEHLDRFASDIFEKLIIYLKNKDIQIELFLCPLPPALWDKYDNEKTPILQELAEYANKLVVKYNLKMTGSYNPYDLGITNAEFYDARHVRRDSLHKYFDFTE